MRASPEHRRGRTYLHGVLLAGTQPFRYRGAVARLLGAEAGVTLRSGARFLPGGAFAYLPVHVGGGPAQAPLAAPRPPAPASLPPCASQRAARAAACVDAHVPARAPGAGHEAPELAGARARAPERETASGVRHRANESASFEPPAGDTRLVSPAAAPAAGSARAPAARLPAAPEALSAPGTPHAPAANAAERRLHAAAPELARYAAPEHAVPAPQRAPLVELARALEAYNFRAAPGSAPPTSSPLRPAAADARAPRPERGEGACDVLAPPPAPPSRSLPPLQEIWIPDAQAPLPPSGAARTAPAPAPRPQAARPPPEPKPSATPPSPAARAQVAEIGRALPAQPPRATQAGAAVEAAPERARAAPQQAARPPRARVVAQTRAAGPTSAFWQRAHLTHLSLRLLK